MASPKKRGLGRGLNSLINSASDEGAPPEQNTRRVTVAPEPTKNRNIKTYSPEKDASAGLVSEQEYINEDDTQTIIKAVVARSAGEVNIESVFPNPDQPRSNFDKEELEELAESIKKDGLLQPIVVRPLGQKQYQIVAGERRWQACKMAGLKHIPIRIKEADDNKALELALIENIQRTDLNPIEEAYGYRRLMERGGLTQSELAQRVSKGRSTIANSLRLLELPEDAQQLLFENKISAGHARAILSVDSSKGRETLTRKICEEKLSVREAENMARLLSSNKTRTVQKRAPLPQSYRLAARELKRTLNANVRVKSAGGKNKLEIEFSDEDDLKRLLGLIIPS